MKRNKSGLVLAHKKTPTLSKGRGHSIPNTQYLVLNFERETGLEPATLSLGS